MVLRPLVKLITLIINYFYSMLCRKASDSWVCAANALQKTFCKHPHKNVLQILSQKELCYANSLALWEI